MWAKVKELASEGKTFKEVLEQCSMDTEFSFVKEMDADKKNSDDWIRPQHEIHILGFFLQFKTKEEVDKLLKELKKQQK